MKRRPGKPQPKKPKTSLTPVSSSRTLAVIDEGPIRAQAMQTYLELEGDIAKLRELLEAFETGDLPAYQRWEARAFGALLTEIRTLTTELQSKDMIVLAIEEEMTWTGCTAVTAYRRVMKALSEPPPPEPKWGGGVDDSDDDDFDDFAEFFGEDGEGDKLFGDRDLPPGIDAAVFDKMPAHEKREFRQFYRDAADLYLMATGREAPPLDEILKAQRAERTGKARQDAKAEPEVKIEPEASPEKRAADRLKELYRKLVLQLHPDHHGEQTPRDRELWHQLQTAYRDKDLELMEALAARIELSVSRAAGSLPVQVLLRVTRELRQALRGLRSQVSTARQNPAWDFRKKAAQLPKIEERRRKNLQHQVRKLQIDVEEVRAYLKDLEAQATKKKSRSKKRPAKPAFQQSAFDF